MPTSDVDLLGRLGRDGLARVLHDALDATRLQRLANTCGLRYPGMRTRSQKRERIVVDLIERCAEEPDVGRALVRALVKATAGRRRRWKGLPAESRLAELEAASDGDLGVRLFLAVTDAEPDRLAAGVRKALVRPDLRPGAEREETRRVRKLNALEKKAVAATQQRDRARETLRASRRELVKLRGELAEARERIDRLEADREKTRRASARAPTRQPRTEAGPSARDWRKLVAAHEKLALDAADARKSRRETDDVLRKLSGMLESLEAALRSFEREGRASERRLLEATEAMRSSTRSMLGRAKTPPKPGARRRGAERVGVFIDVQNVHYGAKRLAGKLDFDALLAAAVGERRLVQATAYVVESREIDQRSFISVLQKRGIDVRRKTLKVRTDGSMKGDWDMEMALDMLDAAGYLDVVVLVSGDGDFTSLVERMKRIGPRVEVLAFPRITAKSLITAADEFRPLNRRFMIRTS